jgi:peptidoglycan/xylan/chitin deacetylase (PgdA/CDA1 family)
MPSNVLSSVIKSKGLPAFNNRIRSILKRYGFSPVKMENSLHQFIGVLQQYQCGASFPLTAVTLKRNPASIQAFQQAPVEFCIHGYTHDDFSSLDSKQILDQLHNARQVFAAARLTTSGFRSPYLSRNSDLAKALETTGFSFSSNQPILWDVVDTTSFTASKTASFEHAAAYYQPWRAAERLSLPYLLDGLVDIPVSLPDDEMLFDRLNLSPGDVENAWQNILTQTYQRGELFTLQAHPERTSLFVEALLGLLSRAQSFSPKVWCAKLSEIAAWWQSLSAAGIELTTLSNNRYNVRIKSPANGTVLIRSVVTSAPADLFFNNYRIVSSNDFSIHSPVRPIIGLSPNSSQELANFLRQQGLIIEFGSHPEQYSLYFDQQSFDHSQERSIIDGIDTSLQPLVRLWRWPNGSKSALAITGDIDALTLWDFGLRLIGG